MKTERNAPCPCGSGKKYKKYCWNKEIENQSTLETNFLKTEQSDYTYIEPIANKLGNILKKYHAKVIQKVGSIYEDQMQQKSFFKQHKEDEKFQRRIDYIRENYNKVLLSLGYQDIKCKIIPYMVTNKVFVARYKEIKFPIVTFDELKQIVNNINNKETE